MPGHSLILLLLLSSGTALASNGSGSYAGGTFSVGTSVGTSITATTVPIAGTDSSLSFNCPISAYGVGTYVINWTCSGGSVSVSSPTQPAAFTGTFLSGTMTFSGSGGGKGGHGSYSYLLTGIFSGTVTYGGVTQFAYGSLSQTVVTGGQLGNSTAPVTSGSLGWNSGVSPVLAADSSDGLLLLADNLAGANLVSAATVPLGIGAISGLAEDNFLHVYGTDATFDRVLRFDLQAGSLLTFGSQGSGVGQFSSPQGIAIDPAGHIWVADAGNNRIVEFDNLGGANWKTLGSSGTGTNQFNAPSSIAFDAQGRIYVADTGNNRLVRIDNISGQNWMTLTQIAIGTASYPFTAPKVVATDGAGHVYLGLGSGYLVGMDDISGANPKVSYWNGPITALSVDQSGTIYLGGGFPPGFAQAVDASATGYYAPSLGSVQYQVSALLALATPQPPPAVSVLSSASLLFDSQSVGTSGSPQNVTLTNLGAAPLTLGSISSPHDFVVTSNCLSTLAGGASCAINVIFNPSGTGVRDATITIPTGGLPASQTIALSGTGTP